MRTSRYVAQGMPNTTEHGHLARHCPRRPMRPGVAGDTNMGPAARDGRLRGELTEFIGRRAELALVRQALGAARLVTLIGPGEGIGKTRLAIEAASGARRAAPSDFARRAGLELRPADRGRAGHVAPGVGVRRLLRPGRGLGGLRGRRHHRAGRRPGPRADGEIDPVSRYRARSGPVPAAGHHRRVRAMQAACRGR